MNRIKQLIKKNFESFAFYYSYLRYKIFISVGISILVGLLDGFGLTMFLPLLQMAGGSSEVNPDDLGSLSFLLTWIESTGLGLNLQTVLLFMVIFFAVKGVAKFCSGAYRTILRQSFVRQLREKILDSFSRIRYKYFVTADVGRIQNTMGGEVERVSRSYAEYFKTAEQVVLVIVYMLFAFFVDPKFALLVTFGGWLTNFFYKLIYKRTRGTSKRFTKESHIYQGEIIQYVANYKYLRATASLPAYASKMKRSIGVIEQQRRRLGIMKAILEAAREPLMIIVVVITIFIQTFVFNAEIGPILVSLLFFYRALSSLVLLQINWNHYLEVSGSLENVMQFHIELNENKEKPGRTRIDSFSDKLEMKGVDFYYGEKQVLRHIDLTIKKNETVAFVGESGSGKTTLINILAGLMPVDQGIYTIDGIDRHKLNVASFQQRIGYITQEPVIFNDTVFNNITFWAEKSEENKKRFREILKLTSLESLVDELPEREETMLGNNGINISGGQKQRISIARELFKDVDILVLDEATSSLDSRIEREIQESLEDLSGKYTMIIIAHRLSTIKNADKIYLMEAGSIKKEGVFEDLLRNSWEFKRMVDAQQMEV